MMPDADYITCDITPLSGNSENDEDIKVEFKGRNPLSGWSAPYDYLQVGSWVAEVHNWKYTLNSSLENVGIERGIEYVNSALTQRNLVEREERLVYLLILMIRTTSTIHNRSRIADRLLLLENLVKDEDINSPGINVGSLESYYIFLKQIGRLKLPTLTLTPSNDIYASWKDTVGNLFSVHFMERKDVQFVVFQPNRRHPGRSIRISGITTADALIDEVKNHDILGLISE